MKKVTKVAKLVEGILIAGAVIFALVIAWNLLFGKSDEAKSGRADVEDAVDTVLKIGDQQYIDNAKSMIVEDGPTMGELLENFFSDPYWTTKEVDDTKYVIFEGGLPLEDGGFSAAEIYFKIEFSTDEDYTIAFDSMSIDGTFQDETTTEQIMGEALDTYNNQ